MQQHMLKIWLLRVTAVFCACLCLFSAVMTGTYAWQSRQSTVNDIWGDADTMIPVLLKKMEITPEGERTENPIPDTVFYLYKEDGTQVGVQYVTDENGEISLQLPVGNYYFEETVPAYGYTYPLNEYGEVVTRFHFEVKEQKSEPYDPVELTVYNRRLSGDLVISKVSVNSNGTPLTEAQREELFTFTVTFSDGGTYAYSVNNGPEQTVSSGGTIQLHSNEIAVFQKMGAGVLYYVREVPVEGYIASGMGHQGNIKDGETALATFINTYQSDDETGTLVITKELRNSDGSPLTDEQKQQVFSFTATIGEAAEEFSLKAGERKAIANIPVGTHYLVMETPTEGYTAVTDTYTGTMDLPQTVTLPFTNVADTQESTEQGTLVVKKRVVGEHDDTDYFTFAVTFEGENAPEDPEPFLLKDGEEWKIENIPHGVSYIVIETNAAGYTPAWDAMQGTIVGGMTTEVEAVNTAPPEEPDTPDDPTPDTVTITVRKNLEGSLLPEDYERDFAMTLTLSQEDVAIATATDIHNITLKPAEASVPTEDLEEEQVYRTQVPYGTHYDLQEQDYFSDGFSQYITNGYGVATEDVEIVVSNTYVGVPRVVVEGEKHWIIPDGVEAVLPESITVQLMDGATVVAEQTVSPNADNKWTYRFVAPLYEADGITEVQYGIREVPVEGYHGEYEHKGVRNIDIINTYVEPITDNDPPVIIKEITGQNAPVTAFTFVFTGQDGAPMPEGAIGSKKEFTITGGGEVEIGSITFKEKGTYVYTVHEKYTGEANWTYDTALYTITYDVTEDETTHQLSAVRTITRNDTEAEKIKFVNSYHEKESSTVTISGVKTWEHRGNPVANRPDSIVIEIYADGKRVFQKSITAADNWCYSAELPKYGEDGHTIKYTVDEQSVRGYSKVIDGYDITNTYRGTTPTPGPVPDTPDTPDTPDKPDKPNDSADTGDNSRIPFWVAMTVVSMLGTIVACHLLRTRTQEGKRVKR